MKFTLMTDEYDSMVGSFESEFKTETYPLDAATFDEAVKEAKAKFAALPRYHEGYRDKGKKNYPKNPRVVAHI